jgi:hypothetical protein
MTTYKVSESEAAALTKMSGAEAPKEVSICKPCAHLMANKDTAIQLLRGTLVAGFRASGVSTRNAEALADSFCKKLADATPNTPVS